MIAFCIIGLFMAAGVISCIVSWVLGLDTNGGMQYDWQSERWIFIPEREDILLEMIIKS